MITEDYLKNLLVERTEIVEYAVNNYELLKNRSDNAQIRKTGTKCDGIGLFYLGSIMYRRDKGEKKGKLIKNLTDVLNYTVYEMDEFNEPLRIRKFNKFGCDSNSYFYKNNGFYYCVPLRRETKTDYGCNVYKYSIHGGKLVEFSLISKTVVILEEYDFSNISEGYYECNWYYYYNSGFNPIPQSSYNLLNAPLDEKLKSKLRNPSANEPIIRKEILYYKIFVQGNKIEKVEEYRNADGKLEYRRTI